MKVNLVRMRPVEEHTELAVRLLNENLQYFYSEEAVTPESHLRFLESPAAKDGYLWVVQKDGKPCGIVSVYHMDRKNGRCEWGRFVVDKDAGGVGSVVEFMVLNFVFGTLGMNKLYCEVFEENAFVVRMHEKFGFKVDGKYRDHVMKGGKYRDVTYLSMIGHWDWEPVRPRFAKIFEEKAGTVET